MKCKLEGTGPAILISCCGISDTENIKSIDYQYTISSNSTVDITVGPDFNINDQILTEHVYRPPLVSVQGLDNNSIFYSAFYKVFQVTALTLGIDPSLSSFAHTLDELSRAAMALEKVDYDNYFNDMKELNKKFSSSADGLINCLNSIARASNDLNLSIDNTAQNLEATKNLNDASKNSTIKVVDSI